MPLLIAPALGKRFYGRRHAVERCCDRLEHLRGTATRYDKTAGSCQGAVTLASLLMWA
ncbi:transposase [Streptomyces sp. B93]|nr:transposase [Streptomyces sp. B93]